MPRARIEHGAACVIDDGSGRRVAAVSATRPSQGISVTICALRDAGMKTAQPSARRGRVRRAEKVAREPKDAQLCCGFPFGSRHQGSTRRKEKTRLLVAAEEDAPSAVVCVLIHRGVCPKCQKRHPLVALYHPRPAERSAGRRIAHRPSQSTATDCALSFSLSLVFVSCHCCAR